MKRFWEWLFDDCADRTTQRLVAAGILVVICWLAVGGIVLLNIGESIWLLPWIVTWLAPTIACLAVIFKGMD